jgi:hypothetical protein
MYKMLKINWTTTDYNTPSIEVKLEFNGWVRLENIDRYGWEPIQLFYKEEYGLFKREGDI